MTLPRKTISGANTLHKAWSFLSYSIALVIVYFSLNPAYPLKQSIVNLPFGDPMIHLCAFGFLMFCFCRAWQKNHVRIVLGTALVVSGIGLEALQTQGNGGFEFEDSLANTLGIGLGYLLGNLRKYQG